MHGFAAIKVYYHERIISTVLLLMDGWMDGWMDGGCVLVCVEEMECYRSIYIIS